MASNKQRNTIQRRDSITSHVSLWDKLPEKNTAPIDIANDDDFLDENDYTEDDTEGDIEPSEDETNLSGPLRRRFASSSDLQNMQENNALWASGEYNQIKLIVQKTNAEKAKAELQKRLSNQDLQCISNDDEKLHSWNFGLSFIRFELEHLCPINIMRLTSVRSFPFWLRFTNNKEQRPRISPNPERIKPLRYGYSPPYRVSLRYGALTKVDQFHYSPAHSWSNEARNRWSLFINNDRADKSIDWVIEGDTERKKKQLLMVNVDRTVVIQSLPDGFTMYICQTCNMNEFNAKKKSENVVKTHHRVPPPNSFRTGPIRPAFNNNRFPGRISYEKDKRVDMRNGVYFATVQFELRIDPGHVTKEKVQNMVRKTLKLLIEFFTLHKITICYGTINSRTGPPVNPFLTMNLRTLIMRYSWQMLVNIGYRFQAQMNEQFRTDLNLLSCEQENPDDLFYRVCVYLSRLFTLEPFVNFSDELNVAVKESKRKRTDGAFGLISSLNSTCETETYVPSVTITPTTIRVKPFKLCRTNRVLRAREKFGKALEHFVLVDIRDENGQPLKSFHFSDLRDLFLDCLKEGFPLIDQNRNYRYLHHSQSQLRPRQFWFYHHEPGLNLSFEDAYKWMGKFDRDRNVAKYASRVALCFTTTIPTVTVNDEDIQEINDIKTEDGKLTFTDGCGTMSEKLRDDIQERLGKQPFRVIQFRYAGAKGVVSVDPQLGLGYHLCIRPSMNKFESKHRCFEVCKVSAPRSLYLNQQAILLLSHRHISDTTFLILQQRNHLTLIRALLRNDDAQNLLKENLPYWFLPIGAKIDFVHEPFFRQIIITACLISTRKLLQKTRIRVPPNKARNMFGIIDEYNVLEPNEVFVQYTRLYDHEDVEYNGKHKKVKILQNCEVVITKNPCHHPGDVRTFTAVNHKALQHLEDVVVFSQQGNNPAPHQISGSDLDGDEYAVIWHEDLVPLQTPNDSPYDYDSQRDAVLLDRPVERDDVNDTVLNIAESDFLGRLCKLHLAYADRCGVDSIEELPNAVLSTIELAGAISEEVDSGKTGQHPLNEMQISKQSKALGNERPDFMGNRNMKSYQSEKILGKLYRSSRRTLPGWHRLLERHRHLRHLQIRTPEDEDEDEQEEEDQQQTNTDDGQQNILPLDLSLLNTKPSRQDPEISAIASELFFVYRQEIREILSLYELSHESDLWCRKSTNNIGSELEDTAYTQLEQLVQRTRETFFLRLVFYCEHDGSSCDIDVPFEHICDLCKEQRNRLAATLYRECYSGQNGLERAPILSLPWLFAAELLQTGQRELPPTKGLLSAAMEAAFSDLSRRNRLKLGGQTLTFRTSNNGLVEATVHWTVCVFVEILHYCLRPKSFNSWLMILSQFICDTNSFTCITSLSQQDNQTDRWTLDFNRIKRENGYADELMSMEWTAIDDELMHSYFVELTEICFTKSRTVIDNDNEYIRISEEIILILQRIAIDETPWPEIRRTTTS